MKTSTDPRNTHLPFIEAKGYLISNYLGNQTHPSSENDELAPWIWLKRNLMYSLTPLKNIPFDFTSLPLVKYLNPLSFVQVLT